MSNVNLNTVVLRQEGTLALGTVDYFLGFAPTGSQGGGITVTGFGVWSTDAAGAGSAPQIDLLTTTSACAVNGTVGTKGSAATTAGTAAAGTISAAFVDAGYGLIVRHKQIAINADVQTITAYVQYVMGR